MDPKVMAAQAILGKFEGIDVTADGHDGPVTQRAVDEFITRHGREYDLTKGTRITDEKVQLAIVKEAGEQGIEVGRDVLSQLGEARRAAESGIRGAIGGVRSGVGNAIECAQREASQALSGTLVGDLFFGSGKQADAHDCPPSTPNQPQRARERD